ncbi:uncharacterized protein LOC128726192 [Anopheles nili]|uniref:uncharacterized protein LOC128726192 n=1 Tax=Anopheles nili TaxID=185578 RepID=UPI00237B600D|nr:uncharacterized protein LOC128726192 [Anopheles nili]
MYRALCALVVLLVAFEQVSCHGDFRGRHSHRHDHHNHHRHRHHKPNPLLFLNFAIYEPKGVELSIRRPNSSAQYFAVELFINNPDGDKPDVSLNTTEVIYGKYIVRDPEAILKPGDSVNVTTYFGYTDGDTQKISMRMFIFTHMITRNCTCENATQIETTSRKPFLSVPPWSRSSTTIPSRAPRPTQARIARTTTTTTTPQPTSTISSNLELSDMDYSDEQFDCEIDPETNLCTTANLIDVRHSSEYRPQKMVTNAGPEQELATLRGVIKMLNDRCSNKPRTKYLTLAISGQSAEESVDWMAYVRRSLSVSPKLTELAETALESAKPHGDVIMFEMKTSLDKLKLLYLTKKNGMTSVQDLD